MLREMGEEFSLCVPDRDRMDSARLMRETRATRPCSPPRKPGSGMLGPPLRTPVDSRWWNLQKHSKSMRPGRSSNAVFAVVAAVLRSTWSCLEGYMKRLSDMRWCCSLRTWYALRNWIFSSCFRSIRPLFALSTESNSFFRVRSSFGESLAGPRFSYCWWRNPCPPSLAVLTISVALPRPLRKRPCCSALFLATSARMASANLSPPVPWAVVSPLLIRSWCITTSTASLNRILARSFGSDTLRAAARPMCIDCTSSSSSQEAVDLVCSGKDSEVSMLVTPALRNTGRFMRLLGIDGARVSVARTGGSPPGGGGGMVARAE
mmetsp:Transcript_32495/g.81912  ORF Transcript_32495/g.81912 Transcript_32495/m.81912 type:complete len:320 (+) Transcript_32495:69-1028(+)